MQGIWNSVLCGPNQAEQSHYSMHFYCNLWSLEYTYATHPKLSAVKTKRTQYIKRRCQKSCKALKMGRVPISVSTMNTSLIYRDKNPKQISSAFLRIKKHQDGRNVAVPLLKIRGWAAGPSCGTCGDGPSHPRVSVPAGGAVTVPEGLRADAQVKGHQRVVATPASAFLGSPSDLKDRKTWLKSVQKDEKPTDCQRRKTRSRRTLEIHKPWKVGCDCGG